MDQTKRVDLAGFVKHLTSGLFLPLMRNLTSSQRNYQLLILHLCLKQPGGDLYWILQSLHCSQKFEIRGFLKVKRLNCRCFLRLFLWVNQSKGKLKLTQMEDPVTLDLDLVGLPYLWWIALCSSQEPILDQSISLLREIHTSLCDTLQEDLVGIRQQFIDKCIEFLEKALEVGGVKWSEGSECSSIASCSMGEGTSEGIEKPDEKDSPVSKRGEKIDVPESRAPDIDTNFWSVGEAQQVEHCLRILRVKSFI